MSAQFLSSKDFADIFAAQNTIEPGASPVDLEPRVQAWLRRVKMDHRLGDAFAIAIQAAKLVPEPAAAPAVSPEQAAWQADVMEGISNQRPLTDDQLAAQVASMSLAEFSRFRASHGIGKATAMHDAAVLDFLGGSR